MLLLNDVKIFYSTNYNLKDTWILYNFNFPIFNFNQLSKKIYLFCHVINTIINLCLIDYSQFEILINSLAIIWWKVVHFPNQQSLLFMLLIYEHNL